jgi:DNA-directed RNA polymerase subunit RPC12/RpoP
MPDNTNEGRSGEDEVVALVPCPNCGKPLMKLPTNYPLYDVQCTGCSFRAQVKTNNRKPADEVFGAGWEVIEKIIKAGFPIPPLIAHFKWNQGNKMHRQILFYPFIPKANLRKRQLSATARRANYKMFNYTGLKKLPHFVLLDAARGK